jgi:hypothetical protein
MRKKVALLLLVVATACASATDPDAVPRKKDAGKRVSIDLVQLVNPSEVQSIGNFDIQYGVSVENLSKEPVTIRRVEIRQIGTGSYVLRGPTDSFHFAQKVVPGTREGVSFWMHAYIRVRPGEFGASEPVSLRATVFFDSPTGPFREVVHKVLGQCE